MSLEDFKSSDDPEEEVEESADNEPPTRRSETLSRLENLDLPEFASVWVSSDGLLTMMDIEPSYFRKHVSNEIKDHAKDNGLIFLHPDGQTIVSTDDPEKHAQLLETVGLEMYLKKRCSEVS